MNNSTNENHQNSYNQNPYSPNSCGENPDFRPNQSYEYDPNGIKEQPKGENLALASMICGILSIVLCCCFGIFSVILGVVAIVLYKKSKDMDGGIASTTAMAGLVCGGIGCIVGVFSIAYWILMLFGIVASVNI